MRLPGIATGQTETVQQKSTRLTLTTREFQTAMRVEAKIPAADGVAALTLRRSSRRRCRRWEPGAHVDLILDGVATRQYSLCGDLRDQQTWRLGILRDANGSGGSLYVHDRLEAGDVVQVRGPRNNFPLVPSPRYLFIAGGIGITPILPMIRAADRRRSRLGARLRRPRNGHRWRSWTNSLDYGDRVRVWPQDERGFLTSAGLLGTPRPDTLVYCCGPEPLLNAVEAALRRLAEGIPARRTVRPQTPHRTRPHRGVRGPARSRAG